MKQSRIGFLPQRHALPLLLAALAMPLAGHAAEDTAADAAKGGMGDMSGMKMHHMHGKRCPMMRGHGGMPQMLHMPRLPPGNDKLQLQMEAEILQKIGEIQGKYANQLP